MSDRADVPLASLDLLRQITDRHVIDQLLGTAVMTRAEIAAHTGISKPTISESVRRLADAGVVAEVDQQVDQQLGQQVGRRRGRAGVYYALRDDLGVALAVIAGPDGLVAETLDVRGRRVGRQDRAVPHTLTAARLDPMLRGLVQGAVEEAAAPVRACALSVAGPVDRVSGRLVHLPNSPFLVDELDPRRLLAPVLDSELIIDNDVNWAAVAEHHEGVAADLDDFCYLHLGHGLGGAVVRDGRPVRGATGLAGEPAHLLTVGPRGRSMRLVEVFAALELLEPGSATIDVARVASCLEGSTVADRRRRDAVVEAVAGAISSMIALLDPGGVVVGGPWSATGDFAERLAEQVARTAVVRVELRTARLGTAAPLIGVRLAATRAAQTTLLGPLAQEMVG